MIPSAMQVWRGKGAASGFLLRLVEVENDRVVFVRIAVPKGHEHPRLLQQPAVCSVGQLELAYEYEREATVEDLA